MKGRCWFRDRFAFLMHFLSSDNKYISVLVIVDYKQIAFLHIFSLINLLIWEMIQDDSKLTQSQILVKPKHQFGKNRTIIRLKQTIANKMQQQMVNQQKENKNNDRMCSTEIFHDLNTILFKLLKYMLMINPIQMYHLSSYSDYFPSKQQKRFYQIFIARTYYYFDNNPLRLQSQKLQAILQNQELDTIKQIEQAIIDQQINITEKLYAKILVVLLNTARLPNKYNCQVLLNVYELSRRTRICFEPIYSQLLSCFKKPRNLRNQNERNWLTPHQNNIISFSIISLAIELNYPFDIVQVEKIFNLTAYSLKPSIDQLIDVQSNTIVALQRWKKDKQSQQFRFKQLLFLMCENISQALLMVVKACLNIMERVFQQLKSKQKLHHNCNTYAKHTRIKLYDFDSKTQLMIVFKLLYLLRPLLSIKQITQIVKILKDNEYYFRMEAQYTEIFYMMRFATPIIGKFCFNTIFRCRQQCITLVYLQEVDHQTLYLEIQTEKGVRQFIEEAINQADFTNASIQQRFISYKWVKHSVYFLKIYLMKCLQAIKQLTLSKQVLKNIIQALFYLRQLWSHQISLMTNQQQREQIQEFVKNQLLQHLHKRIQNQKFAEQLIGIAFCILRFITRQEYYHSKRPFLALQGFLIENFKQFRKVEGFYQYFLELINLKILQVQSGTAGYNTLNKILKQILMYDGTYMVPINIFKNQYELVTDSIIFNGYSYIEKDLLFVAAIMYNTHNKIITKNYLSMIIEKIESGSLKNRLAQAFIDQKARLLLWKYLTHLYRILTGQQFQSSQQTDNNYQFYLQRVENQQIFKRKILIRSMFLSFSVQKDKLTAQQQQLLIFIAKQIQNTLNCEKRSAFYGKMNALSQIRSRKKYTNVNQSNETYTADKHYNLRYKFFKQSKNQSNQQKNNNMRQQIVNFEIQRHNFELFGINDMKKKIQQYQNRQFNKFLSMFRRLACENQTQLLDQQQQQSQQVNVNC